MSSLAPACRCNSSFRDTAGASSCWRAGSPVMRGSRCGVRGGQSACIICGTPGALRKQVLDVCCEVDLILHARDVGRPDILTELEALPPITAVFGNVDGLELRPRLSRAAEFEL